MTTLDYAISNLFDGLHIQLKSDSTNIKLKIECSDCIKGDKDNSIKCVLTDVLQIFVQLEMENKIIKTPFNASCINRNSLSISQINSSADTKSISLSWQSPSDDIIYYLLYFIDNTGRYNHRIININSFVFDNLNEKSWYQICIATINNKWITSLFICKQILTDFYTTGPVTNINVTADIDKIYLSWEKPEYEYDIPQGYIVHLKSDETTLCRIIIINMNNSEITNTDQSCQNKQHETWTKLQKLEINNLPAYSRFTISITPINNNKKADTKTGMIKTKEGKSEAVREFKISKIQSKWLSIEFQKPERTNGEIKNYKFRIILLKNNICSNNMNTIIHEEILTNKLQHWIKLNKFKQCRCHLLEVFPINGWYQNGGAGESASIPFQYKINKEYPISLSMQFLSQNSISLHLNELQNNNYCDPIGYTVELLNENNPSDCTNKIFTNITCDQFNNSAINVCPNFQLIVINNSISQIKSIFSGIKQNSNSYKYKISLITNQIVDIQSGNIQKNMLTNCFTDCYNENSIYSGIRSADKDGNICKQWKYSKYADYKTIKSNICSLENEKSPWCPTDKSWNYCDIPKCSSINQATGCVDVNKHDILSDSLTIRWSKLIYEDKIIGYVTLLHNIDHICEQYHIQLCDNCQSENQLQNRVKNIYLSCKSGHVNQTIKYETNFKQLNQNEKYFVYIIPIIDINMIGEVRNITIQTKLAKPAVPQNIYSNNQSLNSIELSWDKENNFTKYGPTNYFFIVIRNSRLNQISSKTSYNENIKFTDLEMCSSYCFTLRSVNDAGESEWSKEQCYFTLAPKPGNVEIEDIESGYFTSRTLRWKYLGGDICEKIYRLEYQVKHTNEVNEIISNETIISINNLKKNVNYTVKIRPENQMKTEKNENIGHHSNKEFYTGLLYVNVTNYGEIIDNANDKLLNISWNIIDDLKGSLFEFIIVVKNSTNICNYVIVLSCENCQAPWNLKNLPQENVEFRHMLLKCINQRYKNFSSEDLCFNYLLESEIKLNNYSVEIYGINLLGVHQMNRKITIIPMKSTVNGTVTIIILSIFLIVFIIAIFMIIFKKRKTLFKIRKESQNKSNFPCPKKIIFPKNNGENNDVSLKLKESRKPPETPNKPKVQEKKKNTSVNISEFIAYYQKVVQNGNTELIKEYKKLGLESKAVEASLKLTVDAGKETENTKKNRFVNILPFDQNRVKVGDKGYPRDYINASYIPFVKNEKKIEYIAAQGPIDGSLSEFWQMIWEQNIKCIVMLTQTMEGDKFKCLQYWPESVEESVNYGDKNQFGVKLIEEIELEGHIERRLIVENSETNEERKILQLHMHTWFDHSAPNLDFFDKLLFRFQEIVTSNSDYPYLVHCSAGVGRTGTLICLDRIIKDLVSGCQDINIYETVLKLRHYRNFLVQRQAQYIFIHDYLNHFISKYMKIEGNEDILYFNEDPDKS